MSKVKYEKLNDVKIIGQVELQVINTETGEVVRTIKKKNTDTIAGKFLTSFYRWTSRTYLDLITKPLDSLYGQPFSKISKTSILNLNYLRSGLLSTRFSVNTDEKTLTGVINWTNTGNQPVRIYGILSYYSDTSTILTILDLTDEELSIESNYQLIGKYIITYTQNTPDTTQNNLKISILNDNSFISETYVDKDTREYKYTRVFIQKTPHYGINTSEVPESIVSAVVQSSNTDTKKAFGNDSQVLGELVYEIVQDGSVGSAKAKKYFTFPDLPVPTNPVSIGKISWYRDYHSKFIQLHNLEIKPLKIKLPRIDTTNWTVQGTTLQNVQVAVGLIVYWNPDTTTEIYVSSECALYDFDGNVLAESEYVTDNWYKITLPSGKNSGILFDENLMWHSNFKVCGNDVWTYGSHLVGRATIPGDAKVYESGSFKSTDKITLLDSSSTPTFYSCTKEDFEAGRSFGIFNNRKELYDDTILTYCCGGLLSVHADSFFPAVLGDTVLPQFICSGDREIDYTKDWTAIFDTHSGGNHVLVWDSTNSKLVVKKKDEVPAETINATENIGDLTIQFSNDSVFKAGEFWKVTINDNDNILLTDKLETWKVTKVNKFTYENEYWNKYDSVGGFGGVALNHDSHKYFHTPKDITYKVPNFNILDAEGKRKPNRLAIYEIGFEGNSSTYSVLLLPKVLRDENGNELIVDTESILVTDGMHVINHETSLYPDGWKTDNDIEYQDEYWRIKVDNRTLKEIYGDNNTLTKVQLYVFFEAKPKDELLPYEISVSYGHFKVPPTGDYILRVELPFVVDGYIEVVDETGKKYDFEVLKTSLKRLEHDTDKGNILFVKIPVKSNNRIVYTTNYSVPNSSLVRRHYMGSDSYSSGSFHCFKNIFQTRIGGYYSTYTFNYFYLYDRNVDLLKCKHFSVRHYFSFTLPVKVLTFPQLLIKKSQTNNNRTLLTLPSKITYNSVEYVGKYIRNVNINSSSAAYDEFLVFIDSYLPIQRCHYFSFNYNSVVHSILLTNTKTTKNASLNWTQEKSPVYYYKSLLFRTDVENRQPKLDKDLFRTDLSYQTVYYKPLEIREHSTQVYSLHRSKLSIFENTTALRTINIKQPVKILTKYYSLDDLNIYKPSSVDDIEYPVSSSSESYYLHIPFQLWNADRYIFKSEKLKQLLDTKWIAPQQYLKATTKETFDSLDSYTTTKVNLNFASVNTGYYVIKSGGHSWRFFSDTEYICPYETGVHDRYNYFMNLITLNTHIAAYSTHEFKISTSEYHYIFDTTTENVTYRKVHNLKLYRKSTPGIVTLILTKDEIPVDKVESFGKFEIVYYSDEKAVTGDASKYFRFYPVIKIKNTTTGEEKLYALDNMQRVIEIPQHFDKFKNGENINTNWLQYLMYNRLTYEDFDSILSLYKDGDGTYTFSYGFIWYSPERFTYSFKGFVVSPEFNDDTLYDEIPWCWINTRTGLLADTKVDLLPDTVNNKIKIYNPNNYQVTLPVRISLKKAGIDTSQFTDGVIVKDVDNNILPSCYVSSVGKNKPTDKFNRWNHDGIYVKVTLPPKQTVEVTVSNGQSSFTVDDVFEFVENFEAVDKSKWTFSSLPVEFSSIVANQNIDIGDVDTDGDGTNDAHRYASDVVCYMKSIVEPVKYDETNQKLILSGDASGNLITGLFTNSQIPDITTNKLIHVGYRLSAESGLVFELGYNHSNFTKLPSDNNSADSIIRLRNADSVLYRKGTSTKMDFSNIFEFERPIEEIISWYRSKFDAKTQVNTHTTMAVPIKYKVVYCDVQPSNTTCNFGFFIKGGQNSYVEFDYIYITNKYDKEPVVLYEEDLGIAIPENYSTWFIIDTTNPSQPNKTQIQNILDTYDKYAYVEDRFSNLDYELWFWRFYDGYYAVYDLVRSQFAFMRHRF